MRQIVEAVAWESDGNTPNFVGRIETAAVFLRELAGTIEPGETKRAIERAAKRAGFSYSRTFDLWYRKARRVEEYETEAIAQAVIKKRKTDALREFSELRARMQRLEAMLAQSDPEFHGGTIEEIRQQLRR
jgi:hypothetical protein